MIEYGQKSKLKKVPWAFKQFLGPWVSPFLAEIKPRAVDERKFPLQIIPSKYTVFHAKFHSQTKVSATVAIANAHFLSYTRPSNCEYRKRVLVPEI